MGNERNIGFYAIRTGCVMGLMGGVWICGFTGSQLLTSVEG